MVGLGISQQSGDACVCKSPSWPLEYRSRATEFPASTGCRVRQPPGKVPAPNVPCAPTPVAFRYLPSDILARKTELSLLPPGGMAEEEPGGSSLSVSRGQKPRLIQDQQTGPASYSAPHSVWPPTFPFSVSISPPHCSLFHQGQPWRCLLFLSFSRTDHLEMALGRYLRAESPRDKGPREATRAKHRDTVSQRTLNVLLQ